MAETTSVTPVTTKDTARAAKRSMNASRNMAMSNPKKLDIGDKGLRLGLETDK